LTHNHARHEDEQEGVPMPPPGLHWPQFGASPLKSVNIPTPLAQQDQSHA